MAEEIGGIVVRIGAKIDDFDKKMSQLTKKLNTIEKRFEGLKEAAQKIGEVGSTLTKGLTAPLTALAGAITAAAIKTGYWADRISDLTAITGLSVETIQEWQHVSRVAGVEIEAVTRAIEGLIRRLPSLERGSEISSTQLAKLGLTFEDLKKMSPDELVNVLITRLAGLEDTLERNAIASALFGRSWENIAPILALGREGIEQARKEAHRLGLVLSSDAIQTAVRFRIEIDKLKGAFDYAFKSVGLAFMPIIESFVNVLIKATQPLRKFADWFKSLPKPVQALAASFGVFVASIGPALLLIKGLTGAVYGLATAFAVLQSSMGVVALVISGIAAAITFIITAWDQVKKFFMKVYVFILEKYILPTIELIYNIGRAFSWIPGVGKGIEALGNKIAEAKDRLAQFREELKTLDDAQQNISDSTNNLEQQFADLQEQMAKLSKAASDNIQSFDEVHQIMADTSAGFSVDIAGVDSLEDFNVQLGELSLKLDTVIPQTEEFSDNLSELDVSFEGLASSVFNATGYLVEFTEDGIDLQTIDIFSSALEDLTEDFFTLQLSTDLTAGTLEDFNETIEDTGSTLENLSEDFFTLQLSTDLTAGTLEDFNETIEDVGITLETTADLGAETWRDLLDTLETETPSAVDTTLDSFEDLYNELVGHSIIPDLVELTKQYWNDMWDNVVRTTQKGVNQTINETLRLRDKIANNLKETMPWLEKLGVSFEEVGRRVEIATRRMADRVAETVMGFVQGTATMKDVFDTITEGMINILKEAMVSILAQIIRQSIAQMGTWLLNVLGTIGQAIAGFISQAYASLVAFFWWLGPAAPAAAAGVIAGAIAGLGSLAIRAINAFRNVVGLAEGGIVTGPTLAVLGEGRKKEAVIPLERDNVIADSVGRAVFEAMTLALRSERVAGQPQESEIVLEIDGKRFARLILPEILSEMKRQGIQLAGA